MLVYHTDQKATQLHIRTYAPSLHNIHSALWKLEIELLSHLIVVVVSQTVGKIQVGWISRNRIPSGSRVKAYIHDVSVKSAAVQ